MSWMLTFLFVNCGSIWIFVQAIFVFSTRIPSIAIRYNFVIFFTIVRKSYFNELAPLVVIKLTFKNRETRKRKPNRQRRWRRGDNLSRFAPTETNLVRQKGGSLPVQDGVIVFVIRKQLRVGNFVWTILFLIVVENLSILFFYPLAFAIALKLNIV